MKNFFKRYSIIQWIVIFLAIAINVFIIVNSCLPAGPSTQESNWVVEPAKNVINTIKANTINETNYNSFAHVIRKLVGHFSLFLLSGILTTLSIKIIYYNAKQYFLVFIIFSCISGLFLAILTEFIQLLVPGRSGEILDVLIDFGGYLLATLIIGLIIYLKRKKMSRLENEN